MEERQYTQQEVLEMLQNPEKAAQFREQCERKNNIFTKEDDEIAPQNEVIPKEEEKTPNYYEHLRKDNEFSKNGCLMPLEDNGFSDNISDDEFIRAMGGYEGSDVIAPKTTYQVPHSSFNGHSVIAAGGGFMVSPPKLNREEREILEIAAQPGFMDMLREEFRRNPIDYEQAQRELEMGMMNEAQQQLKTLNQQAQW